jgi:hypothetical protein
MLRLIEKQENFNVYRNYKTSTAGRSASKGERGGSLHLRLLAPIQPGQAPQAGLSSRGGRGCEGGPAAAKIRCLLGRSRLGRKRGRLFLRLGRRSQDERLAWRS